MNYNKSMVVKAGTEKYLAVARKYTLPDLFARYNPSNQIEFAFCSKERLYKPYNSARLCDVDIVYGKGTSVDWLRIQIMDLFVKCDIQTTLDIDTLHIEIAKKIMFKYSKRTFAEMCLLFYRMKESEKLTAFGSKYSEPKFFALIEELMKRDSEIKQKAEDDYIKQKVREFRLQYIADNGENYDVDELIKLSDYHENDLKIELRQG